MFNKSENIGYKFAFFRNIRNSLNKEKDRLFFDVLFVRLPIQIHSYRAFSKIAVDHWCLSLMPLNSLDWVMWYGPYYFSFLYKK